MLGAFVVFTVLNLQAPVIFQGSTYLHFNYKKSEKLIYLEIGTQLKTLGLRPPTCTLDVFTACGCCECSWWQREGAGDKRIIREDKRIMETSNVPPLSHHVGVQSHAALTICFVLLYLIIGETITNLVFVLWHCWSNRKQYQTIEDKLLKTSMTELLNVQHGFERCSPKNRLSCSYVKNIAPDINNHLRSIDLFRSMII